MVRAPCTFERASFVRTYFRPCRSNTCSDKPLLVQAQFSHRDMNSRKLTSRLHSQTQCRRRAKQLALRSDVHRTLREMQEANDEEAGTAFPIDAQVVAVYGGKFFLTTMLQVKDLHLTGGAPDTKIAWGAAYFPKHVTRCKKALFKKDAIDVRLCPMEHFTAASDAALAVLGSRPPRSAVTVDVHRLVEKQRAIEVAIEREEAAKIAAASAAAVDTPIPLPQQPPAAVLTVSVNTCPSEK